MDIESNVGGRDRFVRSILAIVLTAIAVKALRSGKRKTGLLALLTGVGFGVNATTCFCGLNKALGIDTTE
jgi:hypothetical protein